MSLNKLSIEDLNPAGKKVLLRVDFNVPLKDGKVDNDLRIQAALPTIKYLIGRGARVIAMSHLGRPDGKVVEKLRMAPVAKALGDLLGSPVKYVNDCVGPVVEKEANNLKDGEVLLLDNIRFYAEEEANDPEFSKKLASLGEIFVNDAFGTAHRAHASTEGVTKFVKQSAAGYLMKKELDYLGMALFNPKKPFTAILGGAKVSDKIKVIDSLLPRVDKLLIGGGMAFTFLKAKGFEIGKSILEKEQIELASKLMAGAPEKLELPVDIMASDVFEFDSRKVGVLQNYAADKIPSNMIGLDIGPDSVKKYADIVRNSKTVVWNGPMGVFEIEATAKGTFEIAKALADATKGGAVTIIGGGDSASAIEHAHLEDQVSFVSTGGGASLKFLEGKALPGVKALTDKT